MIVRRLKKKEINELSRIVGLNYSKKTGKTVRKEIGMSFKKHLFRPEYVVAEDKGKILGFAGYNQSWINYHIYNIFWVNVHPRYQKQGVGKLLVKKIIEVIKTKKGENKANMVLLTAKSPDYYKKFGFKILKEFRRKDYLMGLNL